MSNWKEHPHLFANGKFKIRDPHGWRWVLVGRVGKKLIGHIEEQEDIGEFDIDDCTLIARPMEDMTDEELQNTVSHRHHGTESRKQLIMDLEGGGQYTEDTLYLLSIGVYPFDQDDEDVIFEPKQ